MQKYREFGKLDSAMFEKRYGKLQTDEVVLMDERMEHIKSRHPEDYALFEKYGKLCISEPDFIISDERNMGTVYMIKKLPDTNLNVVLRLALRTDEGNLKNSVMTFWRIREKNLKKLIRKNRRVKFWLIISLCEMTNRFKAA